MGCVRFEPKFDAMKQFFNSLIGLLLLGQLNAQQVDTNWVRQYDRTSNASNVYVASMPDSSYLIGMRNVYYQIGASGDSLLEYDGGMTFGSVSSMLGVEDGVLIGAGFNGVPAIALRDENLDTVWTKALGNSFGLVSALLRDGSDFYASGYTSNTGQIWKFDSNGDTLWSIAIPQSTFTNLSSLTKLADGNFVAGGNLDDYPMVVKFNASGDTLWTYSETIFISFQRSSIYEKANGEVALIARDRAIVLDANGSKVEEIPFSNDCYDLSFDGSYYYLIGSKTIGNFGNERFPYIEIRNEEMDSLGMWEYTEFIHPPASNGLEAVVPTPTGGFLAAGKIRDSINVLNNTYNVFAVRFNDDFIGGFAERPFLNDLTFYPNPTKDVLTIRSSEPIGSYELLDLQGRLIQGGMVLDTQFTLDVIDLRKGFYILRTEEGVARFLKQ